jgi:hypothetical protein
VCDYSLQNVKSRPAKVGERLRTHQFNTVVVASLGWRRNKGDRCRERFHVEDRWQSFRRKRAGAVRGKAKPLKRLSGFDFAVLGVRCVCVTRPARFLRSLDPDLWPRRALGAARVRETATRLLYAELA